MLEAVSGCERASTASSGCAWSSESPISSPLPTSLIVEAKISSPSWSDSSKSIRVLSTGSRRWGEGVRVDDPADGEGCIGDPTSVGAGSLSRSVTPDREIAGALGGGVVSPDNGV